VPARATKARGAAGFTLEGDQVTYTIEATDIEDVVTSQLHSGGAGVNGPMRVLLFRGPTRGRVSGRFVAGTFTAADVSGVSLEALLAEMQAGTAYVDVRTARYPGGEMRGQTELAR